MTSIFEAYSTDPALEQGGVWLDYDDLGKIKIVRASGAKFQKALLEKMGPYRRLMAAKAQKPDVQTLNIMTRLQTELYADMIVIGWEGLKNKDGSDFPYSKANALDLLTALPALFQDILAKANDISTFQAAASDEDSGN